MSHTGDINFWSERFRLGVEQGLPHLGILHENVRYWDEINDHTGRRLQQALAYWPITTVLDVGCGIGNLSTYFPPTIQYTGIDFYEDFILYARQHFNRRNRTFYIADVCTFESPPSTFDLVFCRGLAGSLCNKEGSCIWYQVLPKLLQLTKHALLSFSSYTNGECDLYLPDGRELLWSANVDTPTLT